MTGKLSPADLDRYVFSRTGAPTDDLLVGPAYGEDAAAVRVGDETVVVSTDPISLAAERIGTLGVAIVSNDVAASGGVPEWLVSTIVLPERDLDLLDTITAQLHEEATRLGITIVGGHTEAVGALSRPLLSLTCLGPTDRYVSTSGAEPGDGVVLTKGAGVEGTAVLATDFRGDLESKGVDPETIDAAAGFFDDVSVLPEALTLGGVATAMHDPTEGGVLGALVELARASDVSIAVERDSIPIRAETRTLCDAMGVDPLRILGSGALLAAVPEGDTAAALSALDAADVEATVVGRVLDAAESPSDEPMSEPESTESDSTDPGAAESGGTKPGVTIDGEHYTDPVRDDMYDLWE
ncbi:AIR synthase family protein [Halegenticoccus tardaugens]|uniref:AIR synthase family protein n=1 Tax=Halegenticoccus tardaugens TaxID=2071624 RepID=UPI00100A3C49|nr:AIR synthase family protein [Halegenticoccus tardaugens]